MAESGRSERYINGYARRMLLLKISFSIISIVFRQLEKRWPFKRGKPMASISLAPRIHGVGGSQDWQAAHLRPQPNTDRTHDVSVRLAVGGP